MNLQKSSLNFKLASVNPPSIAQLPSQKRKKRRVQLREAQRRRRVRLKEESKSFLQIILDQETLQSLRVYSDTVGKSLYICAADLIRDGLSLRTQSGSQLEPSIVVGTVREERATPINDTNPDAPIQGNAPSEPTPQELTSPKPAADAGHKPEDQIELSVG